MKLAVTANGFTCGLACTGATCEDDLLDEALISALGFHF